MASFSPKNAVLEKLRQTDIVSKLRCYHAPSSLERAQIVKLIKDGRDEMQRLNSLILLIHHQYKSIEAHVSDHESLLAPIHKLPNEVLGVIFNLIYQDDDSRCSMTLKEPPVSFYLASVCHHWRNVALTIPSLWSKIDIQLDFFNEFTEENRAIVERRLDLQLKNSSDYSLDISLSGLFEGGSLGFDPATFVLVETVFRTSSRWRYAKLNLPKSLEVTSVFGCYLEISWPEAFPRLESLSLAVQLEEPFIDPDYFNDQYDVFCRAPVLKKLELDVNVMQTSLTFPFSQLSHLILPLPVPFDVAYDALHSAKDVHNLTLTLENYIPEPSPISIGSMPIVSISSDVVTLDINADKATSSSETVSNDAVCSLLGQIQIQRASSLRIDCFFQLWTEIQLLALQRSIHSSLPVLTALELNGSFLTEEALISFLPLFPSIQSLSVVEGRRKRYPVLGNGGYIMHLRSMVRTAFLQALNSNHTRSGLIPLPHLRSLSLELLNLKSHSKRWCSPVGAPSSRSRRIPIKVAVGISPVLFCTRSNGRG
jgi:hypothetical protein